MEFTPVIDISTHQGKIDFVKMRGTGVAGLIIRATHGATVDKRLVDYVEGARAAGFRDDQLGFFTFINPKRGSAAECAAATVAAIENVLGHHRTVYMLDVEAYREEPPRRGEAPLTGAPFAQYLRDHAAAVRRLAPEMYVIAYSNHAFWDSPDGPRDAALAGELEFMVPRYPVQTARPPQPAEWGDWIFRETTKRPEPPNGAEWSGWQFSADGNNQGPVYGCESTHLDLNIVHTEAWQRWTSGPAEPAWVALGSGELLGRGQRRRSDGGRIELVHAEDGNVRVLQEVFSTETDGADTSSLVMQTDGNLVLFAADQTTSLWSSDTSGNGDAELRIGADGPVVVGTGGRRLWPTNGASASATLGGGGGGRRKVTVAQGDSFFAIAARELGDGNRWTEIADINGGRQRTLHPGDVLILP